MVKEAPFGWISRDDVGMLNFPIQPLEVLDADVCFAGAAGSNQGL
jgi:hypothetical protein